MNLDQLIVFGVMLLVIVGSWIGNLIKEAQQKEAEKHKEARGEAGPQLDEVAARRRERLRELAKQRQAGQSQSGSSYARYGELEETASSSGGYARYGELEDSPRGQGYGRYRGAAASEREGYARYRQASERQPGQAEGEARYQPGRPGGEQAPAQYERYRQTQERAPSRVADELRADTAQRGGQHTRGETQASPGGRTRSGQSTPQRGGDSGVGAPSHEEAAAPLERDARLRQELKSAAVGSIETSPGQPTQAARRIRRQMMSNNVRDLFIIKELFDKPLAIRDQPAVGDS